MKLAAEIELPFVEFWELTLYEFNLIVEKYHNKKKEDFKERISLEYWNAMWTIQWLGKKSQHPEPLNKILDNLFEEKKVMTNEQMLNQVMMLNKLFGGEEKIIIP